MVTEGRQRSGGKARIAWREYFERLSSGVNILEKFHLERIFWQQNLRFDKVSYVMVVGLLCIIICYGGFALYYMFWWLICFVLSSVMVGLLYIIICYGGFALYYHLLWEVCFISSVMVGLLCIICFDG